VTAIGAAVVGAAARTSAATDQIRTNAARAARRARTINDLPAGIREADLGCRAAPLLGTHPSLHELCVEA
jgi:hypothetical protein